MDKTGTLTGDRIILEYYMDILGLDMGFWVSMTVVLIIVIVMNVVFWKNEAL